MRSVNELIDRLRAEYLEMPGLRLNQTQVEKLCGIENGICQAVLDTLVEERFLARRPDGTYVRVTEGLQHHRPAKASLDVRGLPQPKAS
jgi:hypothetical protein